MDYRTHANTELRKVGGIVRFVKDHDKDKGIRGHLTRSTRQKAISGGDIISVRFAHSNIPYTLNPVILHNDGSKGPPKELHVEIKTKAMVELEAKTKDAIFDATDIHTIEPAQIEVCI